MEGQTGQGAGLMKSGGFAIFFAIFMFVVGSETIGFFACLFGIFALIGGGIMASSASLSPEGQGRMVLKQDASGQWTWAKEGAVTGQQASASQYNQESTQVLSRVIKEVREGRSLENLNSNELHTLATAYGVQGGSDSQKVTALNSSPLARKALKLAAGTAVVGAAGVATVGGLKTVRNVKTELKAKAEEQKAQAQKKAVKAAEKVLDKKELDGIQRKIKSIIQDKNLTPSKLLEMGDFDGDEKLSAIEIAGALTAATGMSVPIFVVENAMKEFDKDGDGNLDISELNALWTHLGFEIQTEEDIDAAIEKELAEFDEVMAEIEEAIPEPELVEEVVEEPSLPEPEAIEIPIDEIVLSDGIDTPLEYAIVEMESARLSSERRSLMEAQTMEHMVSCKITKMEKTLLGDATYRGGQTIHALIDGGPYNGLVKVPVAHDDAILALKEGDTFRVNARLVDFSPSLKRPVLEASGLV